MNLNEWSWEFDVDGNQKHKIARWSFALRSIGWALFRDWSVAFNEKQHARRALIEQQIVLLTLGNGNAAATMEQLANFLGAGTQGMTPQKSAERYEKLVTAIFEAEWPDYEASWPASTPEVQEGENGDPPAATA